MKPIEEVSEEVKAIEDGKKELERIVTEEPEKAEEFITNEIKKAEELKNKKEKIISKPRVSNSNVTSWWNGMGYDF